MPQLTTASGETLAPFAFGTMQFGGKADAAESRAMFDAARAAGIAHFDTAYVYTDGASETLLGEFAAAERDRLYIATKIGSGGGIDAAGLNAQFDTSMSRLGMEQADLLYLHKWDGEVPLWERIEVLARLQAQGRVRHLGLSNFAAWQVMKAQAIAADLGTRIDVIQPMYNLVKRQAEVELLPMCRSEGIVPACYSPLGGGLLTGKYGVGEAGRLTEDERYQARYAAPAMHRAAGALAGVAEELGVPSATLAVAWAARHPAGPVPILSARSTEQLAPSLEAMKFEMDDELYARLSELMPAPPPATDRTEES